MPAPRIRTNEYFRTPETLLPQELVWGYVREAAAPSAAHQRVVGALYIRLTQHLRETGAGEAWPRIGSIEERLGWFATYGVRECWLVHLSGSRIEVVRFDAGVSIPTMFGPLDGIRSLVLPGLHLTPFDVMV